MKNLLNETELNDLKTRLNNLQPTGVRLWGKMDLNQMLAHCSVPFEAPLGKVPFVDESNFVTKTLIKWVVFRKVKKGDFGKNVPTFKQAIITDERIFDIEKQRLLANIDDFVKKAKSGNIGRHIAFGNLTNEEWGGLMGVHLDHHLKQFSA